MRPILKGLKPIIDERTKVLILGSFPGEYSRKKKQYYAYPQNQFWNIMSAVLNKDIVSLEYSQKKANLLANGLGLWDVVKSCRRKGSLDGEIKDCRFNNIMKFIRRHPSIRFIFLNGRKSEELFKTAFPSLQKKSLYLPSSSPANARMTLKQKIRHWSRIGIIKHSK